jgi:hypothetical protein
MIRLKLSETSVVLDVVVELNFPNIILIHILITYSVDSGLFKVTV